MSLLPRTISPHTLHSFRAPRGVRSTLQEAETPGQTLVGQSSTPYNPRGPIEAARLRAKAFESTRPLTQGLSAVGRIWLRRALQVITPRPERWIEDEEAQARRRYAKEHGLGRYKKKFKESLKESTRDDASEGIAEVLPPTADEMRSSAWTSHKRRADTAPSGPGKAWRKGLKKYVSCSQVV